MKYFKVYVLIYFSLLINVFGQWSTDLNTNLQITDWSRLPLSAASDGTGGLYIALNRDEEPYPKYQSYLFKLNKYGYSEWSEPIHIGTEEWQDKVELIEDGYGGVIAGIRDLNLIEFDGFYMVWDYKIRVQRIDSLGNKLWGDGVLVSIDTTDQYVFDICTDGNGGCYVSWLSEKTMDYINSDGYRAIQHISSNGERLWGDYGKVLYEGPVANFSKQHYAITKDNFGGLYAINTSNIKDNYFTRISAQGIILFETISRTSNWITSFNAANNASLVVFSNAWANPYNSVSIEIDKLNSLGQYYWESSVVLSDTAGEKSGIIDLFFNADSSTSIYWRDQNLDGSINGGYYQKVSKNGELLLGQKGNSPFSNLTGGSVMLKSNDDYLCISGNYVQKITENGEKIWGENGIQFTERFADYDDFVSDFQGGFIKVWIEGLNGLWVQQVSANGKLGEVITSINQNDIENFSYSISQNYPNPFNPSTVIKYQIPNDGLVSLKIYDITGQEGKTLINQEQSKGKYEINFDASNLSSGVYFYRLTSGSFTKSMKMMLLK